MQDTAEDHSFQKGSDTNTCTGVSKYKGYESKRTLWMLMIRLRMRENDSLRANAEFIAALLGHW